MMERILLTAPVRRKGYGAKMTSASLKHWDKAQVVLSSSLSSHSLTASPASPDVDRGTHRGRKLDLLSWLSHLSSLVE